MVSAGDQLRFELAFQAAFDDGFWKWNFVLDRSTGAFQDHFSGNTFAASPLTTQDLHAYHLDEVVRLTDRAKIEALILSLVDEKRTVKEISAEVQSRGGLREPAAVELVLWHLQNRRFPSQSGRAATRKG
jgi:hypothetical protein